ncbi:MAG: stage III sporulation protein AB [Bacillota bacterium]|nr:stage III sporulation protein AB [Bacillota bacterium]
MLSLIGAFLVIASGTMIGLLFSNRLIQREKFFLEYISFLTALQTQMKFSSAPLDRLFDSIQHGELLTKLIENILFETNNTITFKDLWIKSISKIPVEYGLNAYDRKLLAEFGASLGTTDLEGQLSHITLHIELANLRLIEAKREKENKVKIYRMLGIFAGICIALLMV